ncbi:hypothetical protein [Roseimaritima sediminicola]|uniref:hypothetical protein n=1 Tax=Roseimaritima sediminicola TaxID=2662066 RepID=UPI001298433C|nr:hypothetical protein [Roseimaritima sediminicola]
MSLCPQAAGKGRRLDERLMQAKQRLRAKRKLEAMLREAQTARRGEGAKCAALKQQLAAGSKNPSEAPIAWL